jgi:hypothetical protein
MVIALSDLALSAIVALATLGGAAVGGVIAAWVTLHIEKRRDGREERRERSEARAAARQVWLELEDARWTFATALDKKVWRATEPSTRAWHEHRGLLASFLPLDDWRAVAQAVGAVKWERAIRRRLLTHPPDPERRTSVEQSRDKLVEALECLEPYLEERSAGAVQRPRKTG